MKRLILAVALLCATAVPVVADLRGGLAAHQRGDDPAALDLLTPLAQAGDADARLLLGPMFHAGKGVEQDFVAAASWLQKAAAAALGEAPAALGRPNYGGEGVPQAARWYLAGARKGRAEAQYVVRLLAESWVVTP